MPAQNGVGREAGADLAEDLSAEDLAIDREVVPLVVVESDSSLATGFLQDVVLGAQILDDLLLLSVHQAGRHGEEKLPGLQNESHGWSDAWRQEGERRPPGHYRSIALNGRRG